ncbi:MAG: PDR/VanB family oxidoreductase [Marinomonas sp.]
MTLNNAIKIIVTQKAALTPEVTLFRLEPIEPKALPAFTAGANVEIEISSAITRAYSLCNAPEDSPAYYEIAVKLEAESRGGSLAMHKEVFVGTELTISVPQNYFPLVKKADHHLLIGGGIGLTPIMSMAYSLSEQQASFSLIACAPSEEKLPFSKTLDASDWQVRKHLSGRENFDITALLNDLPENLHVYCCGPNGFIDMVRQQCLTLPENHFHEEHFAPITNDTESDIELYLSESDLHISVPAGSNLVHVIREAGVEVDTVCEQGICGSCVVPWKDGQPIHHDDCLEPEEREEYLALCCAGCQSSKLTLEL